MATWLIMMRDDEADYSTYSQADFEQMFAQFVSWNEELKSTGRLVGVGRLAPAATGQVVRKKGGGLTLDGPYAEAKEAIVGYFIVEADTVEQAAEVAGGCPVLAHGGAVELRQMEPFPHSPVPPEAA
jgi:hypothetical protein